MSKKSTYLQTRTLGGNRCANQDKKVGKKNPGFPVVTRGLEYVGGGACRSRVGAKGKGEKRGGQRRLEGKNEKPQEADEREVQQQEHLKQPTQRRPMLGKKKQSGQGTNEQRRRVKKAPIIRFEKYETKPLDYAT